MSTTLSRAFHGSVSGGEGEVPGSGGNLNTVYEGWGQFDQDPADEGYNTSMFPAGRLPVGTEKQEFRISDSTAFNNLRGIARTNFPFDPYPAQDHPNKQATALTDNFQQSDMSGVSSLLPGKYSYNNQQGSLSREILAEFDAGTSTYNSLPWAEQAYAVTGEDTLRRLNMGSQAGYSLQWQEGINPQTLVDVHKEAFIGPQEQDVPLTPFHKTYPNFGVGKVDYGFQEPGADTASEEIIRAYHAVLPEGQLAGAKKELMPVFSGINQEAVEQRPILQSLAKTKKTLYLGGVTELPDELRIDPRQALLAGSNVPEDLVQSAGELASALDTLGYHQVNSLHTGNPYGTPLYHTKVLAGDRTTMSPKFYEHITYASDEPLVFSAANGFEYTSNEPNIMWQ